MTCSSYVFCWRINFFRKGIKLVAHVPHSSNVITVGLQSTYGNQSYCLESKYCILILLYMIHGFVYVIKKS